MHRPASLFAGIFLSLLAAFQLCRAVLGVPVIAAGIDVPVWMSYIAFAILASLAFWLLKERGKA